MTFKIISVGGDCLPFIERTLRSVESQSVDDWEVWIVDDAPKNPAEAQFVREWCEARDERWNYVITSHKRWQVENQVSIIRESNPDNEDILVWLDLDGDQLAHEHVLRDLAKHYEDGTLITYGSYQPVPDPGTCTPASQIPRKVTRNNTLRQYIMAGNCPFNHLRTMKAGLFKAIPDSTFHWEDGRWYEAGADYIIMVSAFELAGEREKFIPDVLCLYNHENPLADWRTRGEKSSRCVMNFLKRSPLRPISKGRLELV